MAAAPLVTRAAEIAMENQGFTHARNAPYAGGYTTILHGRRDRDVHALQVEINRGLYLDEERIERGPRYEEIQHRLTAAIAQLLTIEPALLSRNRSRQSFAAE